MSASIRFLGFAVLAWAGVRAVSLGLVPGTTSLTPAAEAATAPALPAIAETQFTPPAPPLPAAGPVAGTGYPQTAGYPGYAGYPPYPVYPAYPRPVAVPFYYPVPASMPRADARSRPPGRWSEVAPSPEPLYFDSEVKAPEPANRLASTAAGARALPPSSTLPGAPPAAKRFDRLELTAWALLRGSPGPGNLATGGTLGGSQVGARLAYKFSPALAATLRSSSSVGGVRYAEVAAGVRFQPMASLPLAVTFERRQALNRWGGRSAFALFAEGGLYQRPVFGLANLDLYAQGGFVGLKSRDLFFDGAATVSRPVWKKWSAGFGVWGGAQPGLYRVDAGPRVSMDVGRGIRLHADYRQRLAGEAAPSSGPTLTIAGDF